MPLNVSKDCFRAPTKCHNCERKVTHDVMKSRVKRDSNTRQDFKRCSKCHLMSYCDKDCQTEHWLRVHKNHCRFLSGQALVKDNKHDPATCVRCSDQNQASRAQIRSEKSPKTLCHIEEDTNKMKEHLGNFFGFHEEGKKCNCLLQFGLELPFPLGEVSGRYLEVGNTGLEAMLAHTLNILNTMIIKCKKGEDNRKTLMKLRINVRLERSVLWYNIFVSGMSSPFSKDVLSGPMSDQVKTLLNIYGASDPWWKALKFSIDYIARTKNNLQHCLVTDSRSMCDPRFKSVKQVYYYQMSQIQRQAIVCEKRMWSKFMVWPVQVKRSLAMVLPPGTRCQSCLAELCGQVAVSNEDLKTKKHEKLPFLFSEVGDDGTLLASCPLIRNENCFTDCFFQNVIRQKSSDKDEWEKYLKERELFEIESRDCDFCMKTSLSSHRCSGCLTVQYCSTVCQNKDLGFHKTVCSTWAKDKSRRIPGKGKQQDHWKELVKTFYPKKLAAEK